MVLFRTNTRFLIIFVILILIPIVASLLDFLSNFRMSFDAVTHSPSSSSWIVKNNNYGSEQQNQGEDADDEFSLPSPPSANNPNNNNSSARRTHHAAPLYAPVKRMFQIAACLPPDRFPPGNVPPPFPRMRIATGIDSITYGNGRAASRFKNSPLMKDRPNRHGGGNWPISLWNLFSKRRKALYATNSTSNRSNRSSSSLFAEKRWKKVRLWIENFGELGATFMTRPRRMKKCSNSSLDNNNNTYDVRLENGTVKTFQAATYRCRPAAAVFRKFVPHVIIVSGGTNDAKTMNWNPRRGRKEFKRAVNNFITFFLYHNRPTASFKPWIILMTPIPAEENSSGAHKYNINASRIESDIVPIMREIGRERRREIDFLDMHELFKRELLERQPCPPPLSSENGTREWRRTNNGDDEELPDQQGGTSSAAASVSEFEPGTGKYHCWMRDGVHPSASGHYHIAKRLSQFMCK